MKSEFRAVPPPAFVPVNQIAETLGLLPGLRAERRGNYRCSNCNTYQVQDAWLVWVPDSVRSTDSIKAVSEQCRQNAYNGHSSGWCLKCALQLSCKKSVLKIASVYAVPQELPRNFWWHRWFGFGRNTGAQQ